MRRGKYEEPDRNYSYSFSCVEHSAATFYILKFVFRIEMALACLVCTTNLFWQLLPKGEDLPFGKESIFLFQKNHPLSEDTKFKLLLCMLLVFSALKNISFCNNNWFQIWKLSIADHSIWIKFIFLFLFAYVPTLLFWMGGSHFVRTALALPFLPKISCFEMILT